MILPQCSVSVSMLMSDGSMPVVHLSAVLLSPPGQPIDDYIIFLFIAALVYGLYVIKKMKSKLN